MLTSFRLYGYIAKFIFKLYEFGRRENALPTFYTTAFYTTAL